MKTRLSAPEHLVDLAGVSGLKGIRQEPGHIVIGAMTTQYEIIGSPLLAETLPILRETSLQIGDPQIRYLGTLGGNVANGDPGNDMPAVMQCLDAEYGLPVRKGRGGYERGNFISGPMTPHVGTDGHSHCRFRIPAPPRGHGYAYEKLKRKVGDYAVAAAAVILTMANGKCTTVSIGLTNVADTPLSAEAAAQASHRHRARPRRHRQCGGRGGSHHGPSRGRTRSGRISHENGRDDGAPRDRARQITRPKLSKRREKDVESSRQNDDQRACCRGSDRAQYVSSFTSCANRSG